MKFKPVNKWIHERDDVWVKKKPGKGTDPENDWWAIYLDKKGQRWEVEFYESVGEVTDSKILSSKTKAYAYIKQLMKRN